MAGGVFLAIAGVWALCQVLGGDALGRLGITGIGSSPAPAQAPSGFDPGAGAGGGTGGGGGGGSI